MSSLLKRIISRSTDQTMSEAGAAQQRPDSSSLLPQVRAGLDTIEETLAELGKREHDLLEEASILYEQLKVTATELANVRRQKEIAFENADKFQAAIQTLERQRSGAHTPDHIEQPHPEAFLVQQSD
jgi:hypothetical protein